MYLTPKDLSEEELKIFHSLKKTWIRYPNNLPGQLRARREEIERFFFRGQPLHKLSTETLEKADMFTSDSLIRWILIIGIPNAKIEFPPLE